MMDSDCAELMTMMLIYFRGYCGFFYDNDNQRRTSSDRQRLSFSLSPFPLFLFDCLFPLPTADDDDDETPKLPRFPTQQQRKWHRSTFVSRPLIRLPAFVLALQHPTSQTTKQIHHESREGDRNGRRLKKRRSPQKKKKHKQQTLAMRNASTTQQTTLPWQQTNVSYGVQQSRMTKRSVPCTSCCCVLV